MSRLVGRVAAALSRLTVTEVLACAATGPKPCFIGSPPTGQKTISKSWFCPNVILVVQRNVSEPCRIGASGSTSVTVPLVRTVVGMSVARGVAVGFRGVGVGAFVLVAVGLKIGVAVAAGVAVG